MQFSGCSKNRGMGFSDIYGFYQWIQTNMSAWFMIQEYQTNYIFQIIPRIVTAECLWGILLSNGITHIESFFLGNFFRILTIEMDSLNVLTKKSPVMFTNKRNIEGWLNQMELFLVAFSSLSQTGISIKVDTKMFPPFCEDPIGYNGDLIMISPWTWKIYPRSKWISCCAVPPSHHLHHLHHHHIPIPQPLESLRLMVYWPICLGKLQQFSNKKYTTFGMIATINHQSWWPQPKKTTSHGPRP